MWDATTAPRTGTLPAAQLESMWRAAVTDETVQQGWPHRRGPIITAALETKRLGWSFVDPWTLEDEDGQKLDMRELSPPMITDRLTTRYAKQLAEAATEKYRKQGLRSEGTLSAEIAQRLLNTKKKTPQEKGLIRRLACQAVWTPVRFAQHGYAIDTACSVFRIPEFRGRGFTCNSRPPDAPGCVQSVQG